MAKEVMEVKKERNKEVNKGVGDQKGEQERRKKNEERRKKEERMKKRLSPWM